MLYVLHKFDKGYRLSKVISVATTSMRIQSRAYGSNNGHTRT